MPTPKKGYKNHLGVVIPGTTSIIGRFKDAGPLMHWAWQQGLEGRNYRDTSGRAADVGTVVHDMIDNHVKGTPRTTTEEDLSSEQRDQVESAFLAFLQWIENFKVQMVETEVQLVCEEYQFGGTPDAVGIVGNSLCLLDWKTSNGVYTDMLVQLAAYRHLWNTNRPGSPLTGGSHLLRFAKAHGDFAHHYFPNLDLAWEQFTLLRKAYTNDLQLKKRAA